MDLSALPVSSENALKRLKLWVETESPTFDRAAVNRMMDVAASDLAALGACVTRVEGTKGFGDSLVARFPHPRADEPGILVMGHLDTVHPLGTLEALRREQPAEPGTDHDHAVSLGQPLGHGYLHCF